METPTSRITSLSRTNLFRFACPIFGAEVELRGCARLHELHMVGKGPETRRGCQAAMSSSKCPIWHMAQLMRHGRDEWVGHTGEVESLGNDVIIRIARIQTDPKTIEAYGVSEREGELLLEANRMWEKGTTKPGKATTRRPVKLGPVETAETKSSNDELTKAAKRGDLAAALNAAAAA